MPKYFLWASYILSGLTVLFWIIQVGQIGNLSDSLITPLTFYTPPLALIVGLIGWFSGARQSVTRRGLHILLWIVLGFLSLPGLGLLLFALSI